MAVEGVNINASKSAQFMFSHIIKFMRDRVKSKNTNKLGVRGG